MSENSQHTSGPLEIAHKADLQETAPVTYLPLPSLALRETLGVQNLATRDRAVEGANAVVDALSLQERIKELGVDSLTGLPTRKLYDELLPRFAERAGYSLQTNEPGRTALVIFDLDNLRAVNNLSNDHAEGDKYIKTFSHALKRTSRPADFLARIGGDEFAEVIGQINPKNLPQVIDKKSGDINKALDSLGLPGEMNIGVSVGYATFEAGDSVDDVKKRAETMLYDKKTKTKADLEIQEMGQLDEKINPDNFASKFTSWSTADNKNFNLQALSSDEIEAFEHLKDLKPGIFSRLQFLSKQIIDLQDDLYDEDEQKQQQASMARDNLRKERSRLSAYAYKALLDAGHTSPEISI